MTRPAFQAYQLAFTAHLRDPDQVKRPAGSSKRRCAIYQELVFNNINSFLESAFPVLRRIVRKKRWHGLVRSFLVEHRSHYPLFRHLPLAFLEYMGTLDLQQRGLPDYSLELAQHEWLELKLDTHPAQARWLKQAAAPLDLALRVNPVLELHAWRYPVHQISRDWQPEAPSALPVFLLCWRDRQHRVRFMQLNAPAARLLHGLQQGYTALQMAAQLSSEGLSLSEEELTAQLQAWLEADVLIGRSARRRLTSSR